MRDPFTWALPVGRLFGITVRIHILFVVFVLVMWLRMLSFPVPGAATWMLALMGLLFLSILLHEFGHCFAARYVDGEADEVLIWPLGGLARCDLPHSPWAHFVTAAGGPLVNLMVCVTAAVVLWSFSLQPSLSIWPEQCWQNCWNALVYNTQDGAMWGSRFAGKSAANTLSTPLFLLVQFFYVNWVLFLFNMLLFGFPMDCGRMIQAMLWPRLGYRTAMQTAIVLGFVLMFLVGIYALVKDPQELLLLFLAWFIYASCKTEWINLEMGGEEPLFGYDFSQGYTSLERDQPVLPRKKRPNFLQRWLQNRAARKLQREQQEQEADDRRMDGLLEKIAREGKQALTEEEHRFLKRVSDRYRNRH